MKNMIGDGTKHFGNINSPSGYQYRIFTRILQK